MRRVPERALPHLAVLLSVMMGAGAEALASVTYFTNDQLGWAAAAGPYKTCDFVGFGPATPMTVQYQASLGITFTSYQGTDFTNSGDFTTLPQDGAGLFGGGGTEMIFTDPTYSIAAHGPHPYRIQLFLPNGVMFYESPLSPFGTNVFTGIVSTTPFAKARLWVFDGAQIAVDNIYFSTVPGPGGIALLGLIGAFGAGGRRRRA